MKFIFAFLLLFAANPVLVAQNADINLLREINLNRNEKLDPAFKVITHSMLPAEIVVPLTIVTIGMIEKDSLLVYKSLYIVESFAVSSFITLAMKYGIQRDRPFVTYPEIDKASSSISPSFPSGHTSSAFSLATSLSISFPKWYVIAPSFLYAGAVGYSRMHLGVHYPSDVLVGAMIGSGSAFLTHFLNKKLFQKKLNRDEMYINLW